MKIVLTGGGSGGHFYPLIAIADEIRHVLKREKVINASIIYIADTPMDERELFVRSIVFKKIATGKIRRYASLQNIIDIFKTLWAIPKALWMMFVLYPDVVVSKGGYAALPVVFAARIFMIPVVMHESDSVPGKVNAWTGKFAAKIAVSYPEAAQYFPKDKTAVTGNPIREAVLAAPATDPRAMFGISPQVPVIVVLGGSQGAQAINEAVVEATPRLLETYAIIHQTGTDHREAVEQLSGLLLKDAEKMVRYKIIGSMEAGELSAALSIADIVITRAGSSLFEIAARGVPAIIIPLSGSAGDHQRKNAFSYARAGAADVIEQENLSPNLLVSEIERIRGDRARMESMRNAARAFARTDAAAHIAEAVVAIALSH